MVSVGQESRCSLAWVLWLKVSHRWKSKCWLGLQSHLKAWLKGIYFPAHSSELVSCGQRLPQFLPHGPLPSWQHASWLSSEWARGEPRWKSECVDDLNLEVTSCCLLAFACQKWVARGPAHGAGDHTWPWTLGGIRGTLLAAAYPHPRYSVASCAMVLLSLPRLPGIATLSLCITPVSGVIFWWLCDCCLPQNQ